jgi:hypothetical protein
MRVNYTLPALLPTEPAPSEVTRTGGDSPFRARLNVVPAPRWLNWRNLLRLDDTPVSVASIGPPPRPPSFDAPDAARQRMLWRQLLDRQVAALEAHGDPALRADTQAIERMLALLMRFREVEDEIASRHLAEPEG